MKNNKFIKLVLILIALAVLFSLSACSGVDQNDVDSNDGMKSTDCGSNGIIDGLGQYAISYLSVEETTSIDTADAEDSTETTETGTGTDTEETSETDSAEGGNISSETDEGDDSGEKGIFEKLIDKITGNYLYTLVTDMGKIFAKDWKLFLIEGLTATILLSLMTVFFGTILGAAFALIKTSKIKPLKWLIVAIVEVVRGTPMLLQLYISTFLFPLFVPQLNDLSNKALICVSITLILNSGAYVSEIIRSGIEAVDKGQTEAARSLGLNGTTTMVQIVLPQAVKNILPALGNEFITIIKETSLASTFYVGELMTQYNKVLGKSHNSLAILMIIGIIYFVMNFVLSKLLGVFERRMKSHA